ncbi:hypothetical protein C5167_030463 [Papaver somniferum]|nr:hypothetical protein C5167_030463 [Papaver somniferum]
MATKSSTLASFLMVLVFVCLVADYANASSLKVWRGHGCNGHSAVIHGCGCFNIPHGLFGGYRYTFTGQPAKVYSHRHCQGHVLNRFHQNIRKCQPFGFRSIRILCH